MLDNSYVSDSASLLLGTLNTNFLSQDRRHKIILLLVCGSNIRQKSARKLQKTTHLEDFYSSGIKINKSPSGGAWDKRLC